MSSDKKTIGITRENIQPLEQLVTSGRFASELDAAKFALAHAIKAGTAAGRVEGAETKWNVGSVDSDGKLRDMLMAFYPNIDEPFRLMEYLINTGLTGLAGNETIPDVYGTLFEE